MSAWMLIDCAPAVVDEADLPSITIESEEQLRTALAGFRQREPASIIELISPEGAILHMGIGITLSGVQWKHGAQLRMAVADRSYSSTGMDFRFQGSDSGFRQKYLLPVAKTIDIALHFYKTGHLPDWFPWAEWNPVSHRLEVPADKKNGVPGLLPQTIRT